MLRNSLFGLALVAVGAVAGVYTGGALNRAENPAAPSRPAPAAPATPAANAATDASQMYDALAAILEQEVSERQRLEEELVALRETVTRLERTLSTSSVAPAQSVSEPATESRRRPPRFRRGGEALQQRLVDAGLDPDRAEYIARRRDELALERMYLQDQAAREGWANTPRFSEAWLAAQDRIALEGELSDAEFETYLRTTGQANRVTVNNVLQTSPAEQAGLQRGDRLVSYDGQRIYSGSQLRAATRSGEAGEVVIVTVERDGQQVQLSIPRGPLGVNLGFSPPD
jgi:C-terminal processing protease CtpA/Prc